jgi:hypothetical protein
MDDDAPAIGRVVVVSKIFIMAAPVKATDPTVQTVAKAMDVTPVSLSMPPVINKQLPQMYCPVAMILLLSRGVDMVTINITEPTT